MAQAEKRKGSTVLTQVQAETVEQLAGTPVKLGYDRGDPRIVFIAKLSFDQWLGIAKLALRVGVKLSDSSRKDLAKAAAVEDSDSIASVVLSLLDKETLLSLVALLANVEEEWIDKYFSMAEFAELLDAVDEKEDLRRVIAPFQRIGKRWQASSKAGAPA